MKIKHNFLFKLRFWQDFQNWINICKVSVTEQLVTNIWTIYHYSFTKTQKSIWLIIVKIRKRNAWISGENVNITWYDKFSKFCSFVTERIFEHFLNVSVLNNIIFVKHDISSWQYRLHMKSKFKKNGKSWNTQKFQSRQLYTGQFAVIKNN